MLINNSKDQGENSGIWLVQWNERANQDAATDAGDMGVEVCGDEKRQEHGWDDAGTDGGARWWWCG